MKSWLLALLLVVQVLVLVLVGPAFVGSGTRTSSSPVSASSSPNLVLEVLPGSVNRYDFFLVTVIAPPNTTFDLQTFGANGFFIENGNRTSADGVWSSQIQATYDYGTYSIMAKLGNVSVLQTLTVACDSRCQAELLDSSGQAQLSLIYALATQYGTYLLLLFVAFELPKTALFFRDRARRARDRFAYTDRDVGGSLFARMRGFIQPGDQVYDPANVQNPRIAADMERRRILEQIHEATGHRFLEWVPQHIANLRILMRRLESVWDRQLTAQQTAAPYAHVYELPPAPVPPPPPETVPRTALTIPDGITTYSRSDREEIQLRRRARPASIVSSDHSVRNGPREVREREIMAQTEEFVRGGKARRAIRWIVYAAGTLAGIMVLLVLLAYVGIYVDPLRSLWIPWPSDPIKVAVGLVVFVIALGIAVLEHSHGYVRGPGEE